MPVERAAATLGPAARRVSARTDTPTGWGWLAHLRKGEFAGLIGIAMLAGCSAVCLVAVVPVYARRGDRVYAGICVLEIRCCCSRRPAS